MKNTIYLIEAKDKKGRWRLCYYDLLTEKLAASHRSDIAEAVIVLADDEMTDDRERAVELLVRAKQDLKRKCRIAAFKITRTQVELEKNG